MKNGVLRMYFQIGDHPEGLAIWLVMTTPDGAEDLCIMIDATEPYMAFLEANLNPLCKALAATQRQKARNRFQ